VLVLGERERQPARASKASQMWLRLRAWVRRRPTNADFCLSLAPSVGKEDSQNQNQKEDLRRAPSCGQQEGDDVDGRRGQREGRVPQRWLREKREGNLPAEGRLRNGVAMDMGAFNVDPYDGRLPRYRVGCIFREPKWWPLSWRAITLLRK